jgi:hypothetical protein
MKDPSRSLGTRFQVFPPSPFRRPGLGYLAAGRATELGKDVNVDPRALSEGATQRQESNPHHLDHFRVEIEDSIQLSYAANALNELRESSGIELTRIALASEIDVNFAPSQI